MDNNTITAGEYAESIEGAKWISSEFSTMPHSGKVMARVLLALAGFHHDVMEKGYMPEFSNARHGLPVDGEVEK